MWDIGGVTQPQWKSDDHLAGGSFRRRRDCGTAPIAHILRQEMIREILNEKRAKAGLNGIPTGEARKGSVQRRNFIPSWVGLEEIERDGGLVKFKTLHGSKYVSEDEVNKYYRR